MKENISLFFGKIKKWVRWYWILAIIVLIFVLFSIFKKGGNEEQEFFTVVRQDVVEEIVVSGKTEEESTAELGFASAGRVEGILVQEGNQVRRGQLLVQLEIDDLIAERVTKESEVALRTAELRSTTTNLSKTTEEEDVAVASAYRTLLSEGLVAEPQNRTVLTAPIITGLYDGAEGEYKIIFTSESAIGRDYLIRTFNLEKTTYEVEEHSPTPLGTRGLFISFPDQLSMYKQTIWYVTIPNKTSSLYLQNYNTYQEALKKRDRAVAEKNQDLSSDTSGQSVAQARLLSAEAAVRGIEAEIKKASIHAPFSGVISNLDIVQGETVSSGDTVLSLVGENTLRIKIQIPEIDIPKLTEGLPVMLTLDAFPGETFLGELAIINVRDREVDGVSVYEGYITLSTADPRIRTGMTAYSRIETKKASNTLAIPKRFIQTKEGTAFVQVKIDEAIQEKEIVVGIEGSDSFVEIKEGLSEGDVVTKTK